MEIYYLGAIARQIRHQSSCQEFGIAESLTANSELSAPDPTNP